MSAVQHVRPEYRWLHWRQIERGDDVPYLSRLHLLPRNRWLNIYLHVYKGPDDIRFGLHDHPWHSVSLRLWGTLYELYTGFVPERHTPQTWTDRFFPVFARKAPRFIHRRPERLHAVFPGERGAVTLFITGPTVRRWGFYGRNGWEHWREVVAGKVECIAPDMQVYLSGHSLRDVLMKFYLTAPVSMKIEERRRYG